MESILTRHKAKDVITMLDMADELGDTYAFPSFITSKQVNGRASRRDPISPSLLPIPCDEPRAFFTHDLTCELTEGAAGDLRDFEKTHHKGLLKDREVSGICKASRSIYDLLSSEEARFGQDGLVTGKELGPIDTDSADLDNPPVIDPKRNCVNNPIELVTRDLVTQAIHGAETKTTSDGRGDLQTQTPPDAGIKTLHDDCGSDAGTEGQGDEGIGGRNGGDAPLVPHSDNDGELESDDEQEVRSISDNGKVGSQEPDAREMADPTIVASKMKFMEGMIALLDSKSTRLHDTVKSLEDSLEFAYNQIADLKKENGDLRLLMNNLEMEDRRTQYQVKDDVDKLDKLDSATKKQNLLFEGIPETASRKEAMER